MKLFIQCVAKESKAIQTTLGGRNFNFNTDNIPFGMYRHTDLMEQRRIRPTLNRKEFMRVAPHLPEIRSHHKIQKVYQITKNGAHDDKSVSTILLLHGMYSNEN